VASKATFKAAIVAQGLAELSAGEGLELAVGLEDSSKALQAEATLGFGGEQAEDGEAMVAETGHQFMGRGFRKECIGEANGGEIAVGGRWREFKVEQIGVKVVEVGEGKIAGKDLIEGAMMQQPGHVVEEGQIALGREEAMALNGTAEGPLEGNAVEFRFDDEVLCALADERETDQFVARRDEEDDGDISGGAAELKERRHGGVVNDRGVIEEEDIEGGAAQFCDRLVDVERIRALPASAQTTRKAGFVHLGESFFEQQDPVGIVAGDENSIWSFSHGEHSL
jgi:hypothetical protein